MTDRLEQAARVVDDALYDFHSGSCYPQAQDFEVELARKFILRAVLEQVSAWMGEKYPHLDAMRDKFRREFGIDPEQDKARPPPRKQTERRDG